MYIISYCSFSEGHNTLYAVASYLIKNIISHVDDVSTQILHYYVTGKLLMKSPVSCRVDLD